MKKNRQNKAFGLDIGQSCVRMLSLQCQATGQVTVTHAEELNIADEGILDETELFSADGLGKWLKANKLQETEFCIGLPQYLCTIRLIYDLKTTPKPEILEQMVQQETSQLVGLSEDSFLADYQILPPAFGVESPLLIGFIRENSADEYATRCKNVGIKASDLAMSGMALANAFCYLHPEEMKNEAPQLLLDIGTENATIAIIAGGSLRHTGALMFGARRFTQILTNTLNCSEAEAEKQKRTFIPDWNSPTCPYLLAARQLETELKTALDNWRTGELPQLANKTIGHIWLSGGGAKTPGLAAHLQDTYGCPVALFGPTLPESNQATSEKQSSQDENPLPPAAPSPEFTIALGLALQDAGISLFHLSMAPLLLRWQIERKREFRYLVYAVCLFFIPLLLSELAADLWITNHLYDLNEGMSELHACDILVPKLDTALAQMEHQQKLLLPLVEMGSRGNIYMRTLEEIGKAMGTKDWCIFFSDEFTHRQYKEEEPHPVAAPKPTSGGMFAPLEPPKEQETSTEIKVNLHEMPLLKEMIIGGFTSVINNKRYEAILAIQTKLRENPMFTEKVDWLDENLEWTKHEQELTRQWEIYLKKNEALFGSRANFKLKLPLAKTNINLPDAPVSKKSKKKK